MDEEKRILRNHIMNEADMLNGCKNRMCITDDEDELSRLYVSLNLRAANLFQMNLKRIRNRQYEQRGVGE